jgi:hypothetical protein
MSHELGRFGLALQVPVCARGRSCSPRYVSAFCRMLRGCGPKWSLEATARHAHTNSSWLRANIRRLGQELVFQRNQRREAEINDALKQEAIATAAKVPTSFDELRGGTRGRLKLHNFRRTPPRALPDSKRELQRAVADLYRWGAICRSGIELFLMKATWKPWFVCGNRTRNSVKRYEQLYRGAENPALLA